MKKNIRVSELVVGMYVVRVMKSNGSAKMKSQGLINSKAGIEKLKELQVLEVEIDTSKANQLELDEEDTSQPFLKPEKVAASEIDKPTVSLNKELQRAQDLYATARELQRNAFEKIRLNGNLNIAHHEEMAKEFFESILRNQDALLCMTKLQDKDSYLLEHSINVGILLAIFSNHLGFNKSTGLKLTLAGLLHDIGKAKVPDEILLKQGKLTRDEFDEIKNHTVYGADILSEAGMDGLTIQIAVQHHERLSGSGYPAGLMAHQLNQYVRMSCIVDVYDAITAERVYKKGMTPLQAIKIIQENGKSEFDEKLLTQFVRAIGIFSIGSVVLLTSQKLAVVNHTNYEEPLKPSVTTFYQTKFNRHIENNIIDLASKSEVDSIVRVVNPTEFGLNQNVIIQRIILGI